MTKAAKALIRQPDSTLDVTAKKLVQDIRALINNARSQVAQAVNAGLVTLYWNVGRHVGQDILGDKRADYGEKIVYSLRRQLTWTHFRKLIYLDDPLKREFYAEMCRVEGWNTRTLDKKIGGMLFERTALSKKPAKLAALELKKLREEDHLSPDLVFRDPYFLDFLGLKGAFQEKDLEAAILREMEAFILELDKSGIRVAEYMTELPPLHMLEKKLHQAVVHARVRLEVLDSAAGQGRK